MSDLDSDLEEEDAALVFRSDSASEAASDDSDSSHKTSVVAQEDLPVEALQAELEHEQEQNTLLRMKLKRAHDLLAMAGFDPTYEDTLEQDEAHAKRLKRVNTYVEHNGGMEEFQRLLQLKKALQARMIKAA